MLRTIAIYYSTVHLMWCVFIIRDSKDTRDSLFSAYTVAILNRGHLYSVVYVIEIDISNILIMYWWQRSSSHTACSVNTECKQIYITDLMNFPCLLN